MRHTVRGNDGVGHHAQRRAERKRHGRAARAVKKGAAAELRLNDGNGDVEVVEYVQGAVVGGGGNGFVGVAVVGQLNQAAVGARAGGRGRAVEVVEAHAEVRSQQNFHLEAGVTGHGVGVGVGPTEAKLVVGVDGNTVALGVRGRAAQAEAEHVVAVAVHVKAYRTAAARHVGEVGELGVWAHAHVRHGLGGDALRQIAVGQFAGRTHIAGAREAGRRGRHVAVAVGVEHGRAGRAGGRRLENEARRRRLGPAGTNSQQQ